MRTTNSLLKTQQQAAASRPPASQRSATLALRRGNQSKTLPAKINLPLSLIVLAIACDVTMALPTRNVRNELALASDKLDRTMAAPAVIPADTKTLSRRKRLAQGDRRLTNLYSKTGFLLGLEIGGRVTGYRHYSLYTLVEIKSVQQGSIVSFYFPNAGRYLAMKRGKLYSRKTHLPSECNFREEIHDNYVSYSMRIAKRRKRRSGSKYFIGIGRGGRPRKGNRISWSSEAALFVHSNP